MLCKTFRKKLTLCSMFCKRATSYATPRPSCKWRSWLIRAGGFINQCYGYSTKSTYRTPHFPRWWPSANACKCVRAMCSVSVVAWLKISMLSAAWTDNTELFPEMSTTLRMKVLLNGLHEALTVGCVLEVKHILVRVGDEENGTNPVVFLTLASWHSLCFFQLRTRPWNSH